MPHRPILFSVAHSSAASGAHARYQPLTEYAVSLRASLAAVRNLAGEFPVELLDVGPFSQKDYDDLKVDAINRCKPKLAIEIHCNASDNEHANYSEVLYHRDSKPGAAAAQCIASALEEGFHSGHHKAWKAKGARPNTMEKDLHLMFFLERTMVPAVIVEGLFISNLDQVAWLQTNGGAETYGLLVAEGVRRWIASAS